MYTVPRALSPNPNLVDSEKCAIHYFRCRAALEMVAPFDTLLWNDCVFQLAEGQRFLMSALMALSTMHEAYSSESMPRERLETEALHHYNKAIREISQSTEPELSLDALLVTIVIFHSFESLRGFFQRALHHVQSGIKIIGERLPESRGHRPSLLVHKAVYGVFLALQNQAREFSNSKMTKAFNTGSGFQVAAMDHFSSWDDAHSCFETMYDEFYNVIDHCQSLQESHVNLQEVYEAEIRPRWTNLENCFISWRLGMEKLDHVDEEEKPARLLLKMFEALFTAVF